MIKLRPAKQTLALFLSLQSACFLSSSMIPSEGSRLAEEHYAVLTQAHNRVYKRDFVDWSKEIWGDPVPAKKGETLHEGMQVGTANKSWAEITWPSVTTRAWENSVVAISPGKRLVYLLNGEMLYQLDKNRKDKGDTVIWTRVLQLRLHGTSVLVQAMADFTRVAVLEGEIDVTNRYDNSVISLKPGAVYEVRTGSAPSGPPTANLNESNPTGGSGGGNFNSGGNSNNGSFRNGTGNQPGWPQGGSNSNYANQLNSSDWQLLREMKQCMPGIPEPQNWGQSDYQKFQDMKAKWPYIKQQEQEKKQKEEEIKRQYWQNKYKKGSLQETINIASTIDGEPDIYPPTWRSPAQFDNLVDSTASGAYAKVGYGQDCPQGQWQQGQGNCQQGQNQQQCQQQQWQKNSPQQGSNPQCNMSQQGNSGFQNQKAGANKIWNQNQNSLQNSPSLFTSPPIASKWNTTDLAPLGGRKASTVKNTDSSFVPEIVSWNSPPINVFRTERSATNIYVADTDAILKHPLLGSSFAGKIASADLIQSSLGRYSSASKGTAGDPTQVRNQVLDEAVAVVQAPTVPDYQTGKELGPGNRMPGSRKAMNLP